MFPPGGHLSSSLLSAQSYFPSHHSLPLMQDPFLHWTAPGPDPGWQLADVDIQAEHDNVKASRKTSFKMNLSSIPTCVGIQCLKTGEQAFILEFWITQIGLQEHKYFLWCFWHTSFMFAQFTARVQFILLVRSMFKNKNTFIFLLLFLLFYYKWLYINNQFFLNLRSNLTESTKPSHQHVRGFIDISQKIINTLRVDFSGWPVGKEQILQGLETVVIDNYVFDFKKRNQILSHPAC